MMTENQFNFWQKWFTYANLLAIGVGLITAFAGNSFVMEIHNDYTKEIFFHSNSFNPEVLNLKNWLFGIIGGTIVGFHILMMMISENAIKEKKKWSYRASWYGLLSWFIIDSSISVYYGALHNLILINIVALVLIGLPLIMIRKEFNKI